MSLMHWNCIGLLGNLDATAYGSLFCWVTTE
jgi:hypothetical protein